MLALDHQDNHLIFFQSNLEKMDYWEILHG